MIYFDVNKRLYARAIAIAKITIGYDLDEINLVENTLSAHKAAIAIIMSIKMGWLTNNAPATPKRTGVTIITDFAMIAFKFVVLLPIELKSSDKSFLQTTKKRIDVKRLRVIANGIADKGCKMPNIGYKVLIKSPINIKKAILKPTENRIVSTTFVSFNLRSLRKTKPGTNDK